MVADGVRGVRRREKVSSTVALGGWPARCLRRRGEGREGEVGGTSWRQRRERGVAKEEGGEEGGRTGKGCEGEGDDVSQTYNMEMMWQYM